MNHVPKSIVYSGILVISLSIIGASFWYKHQVTQEREDAIKSVTNPIAVTKKNTIVYDEDTYSVEVEYPFIPEAVEGGKEANEYFKKFYTDKVNSFVRDTKETLTNTNLPQEFRNGTVSSYYDVSFEESSTTRYISFVVSGETYTVGAAHPSHEITTFVFDIKAKKLVTLKDIFTGPYLLQLSTLSKAYFSEVNKTTQVDQVEIDTTDSNDGFTPTEEHFSRIKPTKDGLVIYFAEYQVAPYAAGPQEVLIPYSELKSIINPEGILADYK